VSVRNRKARQRQLALILSLSKEEGRTGGGAARSSCFDKLSMRAFHSLPSKDEDHAISTHD
jgi:hypothetical protein